MKRKMLYALFVAAFFAVIFLNNSGGAGAIQNADRTGSPLSIGACNECHGGGSFNPTITASLLKDNTVVTRYSPGEDYTFRLTITPGNGTPARYGFQAVALRGENNQNAGTWDSAPSGTQVTTISNRQYFEQSSPRTTNTFDIKWKAPAAGSGPVRFYAAGNAANNNGSSSGDASATLANPLVISEGSTSSAFDVELLPAKMTVYPNPVETQLNLSINIKESGRYFLSVHDMMGKELQRRTIQLLSGDNQESLNVNNLAAGHYAVRLSDGKRVTTQQMVKR
ncbi:MAG: choice-of-anchor V domain-containing protein [Saprospiraceae bacterium]